MGSGSYLKRTRKSGGEVVADDVQAFLTSVNWPTLVTGMVILVPVAVALFGLIAGRSREDLAAERQAHEQWGRKARTHERNSPPARAECRTPCQARTAWSQVTLAGCRSYGRTEDRARSDFQRRSESTFRFKEDQCSADWPGEGPATRARADWLRSGKRVCQIGWTEVAGSNGLLD